MLCRILLTILCVLAWGSGAHAQALQRVTNCGDGNPPAGASPGTQDVTGKTCVNAVVNGTSIATTASLTRPNNTTTYTANTGWNNATSTATGLFTFANACPSNAGGSYIPQISIYSSANPTTKLQGILWLFNVTPGTLVSDNATFNVAAADFANLTGGSFNGISFTLASAQASGATNSGVSLDGTTYQVQCGTGSKSLFGMVQVVNAYVPAANEVLTVRLSGSGIQ